MVFEHNKTSKAWKNRQGENTPKKCKFSEDGKQTASINKKISRFHCTLEILDGDKAVIYDGAEDTETIYNASSHGSYLDGIRIDSRNGGVLTGSHRLLLGGNYDGDVHTYSCEISKTHFVSQYFNQKMLNLSFCQL